MSNLTVDQTQTTPENMLLDATDPYERKMLVAERQFAFQQREAMVYAKSEVVPKHFQNKVADCIIAQEMANRLNVGVVEIMQNLYVVHGNPTFSGKYILARINTSGKIKGQLKHNFVGTQGQNDWGCYCSAIDAQTGEEIKGPTVTIQTAIDEGWMNRSGSKWKTIPEIMLHYRAAAWFGNTKMPEATFGMLSVEEAEDVGARKERDITPLSDTDLNERFKPKLVEKKEVDKTENQESVDAETGEVEQEEPEQPKEKPTAQGAFGGQ